VSETSSLRLFLDRSTQGRRFVDGVRRLVDDVETIDDRYGRQAAERVPDPQWIADATADGRILVGADRYILRNPLERRAICRAGARYVVSSTNNLRVALMLELFTENLARVRALVDEPGPWVYRIAQHGFDRLTLNCDDA
jgi:hypothetical protein